MDIKKSRKSLLAIALISAIAAGGTVGTASAQDLASIAAANMAFDNQQNAILQAQVGQLQQAHTSMIQNYIAQNGPRLQQEWQQSGMQMSFEQFVEWHISTAGGTNYGPALQAQRNQFAGWQAANATVQSGYDSYNAGYWQNQAALDNGFAKYSNEAIQGNAIYNNPQTGENFNLPYGGQGAYTQGYNTFATDNVGNYHQVDSLGYQQQLELGE